MCLIFQWSGYAIDPLHPPLYKTVSTAPTALFTLAPVFWWKLKVFDFIYFPLIYLIQTVQNVFLYTPLTFYANCMPPVSLLKNSLELY